EASPQRRVIRVSGLDCDRTTELDRVALKACFRDRVPFSRQRTGPPPPPLTALLTQRIFRLVRSLSGAPGTSVGASVSYRAAGGHRRPFMLGRGIFLPAGGRHRATSEQRSARAPQQLCLARAASGAYGAGDG